MRKEIERIFKYGDIRHTSFTADEELNSLIYETLLHVSVYGSYKLLKQSVFWLTLYTEPGSLCTNIGIDKLGVK